MSNYANRYMNFVILDQNLMMEWILTSGWPCTRTFQNAGRALHLFLNKDDVALAKAASDADASPSKGIDFAGKPAHTRCINASSFDLFSFKPARASMEDKQDFYKMLGLQVSDCSS